MNGTFSGILATYDKEIQDLFLEIRDLILQNAPGTVQETLWAKMPSFFIGDKFVRVIPFQDHVNIEAAAVVKHRAQLEAYRITPKGMLQVYLGQELPRDVLNLIVQESFV